MRHFLLVLALTLATTAASACDCRHQPMDDADVRAAQHVFVVRVLSTRLIDDDARGDRHWQAVADVRVVESLRGDGQRFNAFRYWTSPCCGIRIDPGHYYFVAASGDGPTFDGNPQTLVDFGPFAYDEPPRESGRRHFAHEQAREVESGRRSIDKAFAPWLRDRLLQAPPPPPPPPAPESEAIRHDCLPTPNQ
jgi:hypothetical protein